MMFMIIVGVLACGITFMWLLKKNGYFEGYFIPMSLCIGLCGALVALLTALTVGGIALCCDANIEQTNETRTELIALRDNFGMNGTYYLHRAYIDEELQYSYLYNVEGKGICSGRVEADETYVNYITEGERPYLVKHEYEFANPIINFISGDLLGHFTDYSLYIPEESITVENQYEIDLE